MPLSNVNIIKTDGAFGTPPADQSGISAFLMYGTNAAITTKIFTATDALAFTDVNSALYYHISEFYRFSQQPLYVKTVAGVPTTFSEVVDLKNYSNGEIRQIAVYNLKSNFATSQLNGLQTVADQCESEYAPLQIIYSAATSSGQTLSNLPDLTQLSDERVSFIIGEDKSGRAASIRATTGKFVSTLGTTLGCISLSNVQESIGWAEKFNLVSSEYSNIGFITGDSYSTQSATVLNTLNSRGYIFVRTITSNQGVYHNKGNTSVSPSNSDFSLIEYNRAYDLAYRNIRQVLTPDLNRPLYLNSDGTIDGGTIKYFENKGTQALQSLKDNGNISGYSFKIDPTQKVITTRTLNIVAKLLPVGGSEFITVQLGYTLSIA